MTSLEQLRVVGKAMPKVNGNGHKNALILQPFS